MKTTAPTQFRWFINENRKFVCYDHTDWTPEAKRPLVFMVDKNDGDPRSTVLFVKARDCFEAQDFYRSFLHYPRETRVVATLATPAEVSWTHKLELPVYDSKTRKAALI